MDERKDLDIPPRAALSQHLPGSVLPDANSNGDVRIPTLLAEPLAAAHNRES